jgi:hypothetical protein
MFCAVLASGTEKSPASVSLKTEHGVILLERGFERENRNFLVSSRKLPLARCDHGAGILARLRGFFAAFLRFSACRACFLV